MKQNRAKLNIILSKLGILIEARRFMKKILYIVLLTVYIFITGCETLSALPDSFNTKNIMKVKDHMSADSILETFGSPKNISSNVCGTDKKWNCTTWSYGEYLYGYASFTFYHKNNELFLNHFNIDRN